MQKTFKEIVFAIKEGLSSYNITDDSVFEESFIQYQVDIARISLIKDEIKSGKIPQAYYQKNCCIEIQCAAEGCDVPGIGFIKSGDLTYYIEPGLIAVKDNAIYIGSALLKNEETFNLVSMSSFMNDTQGVWSKNKQIATEVFGKVLLKNLKNPGQKYVCVIGLFESPLSVCDYNADKAYPIADPLKIEIVVVKNILSKLGINYDNTNNASPDINTGVKK